MVDILPEEEQLSPNSTINFIERDRNRLRNRKIFVFSLLSLILLGIWSINQHKQRSQILQNNPETEVQPVDSSDSEATSSQKLPISQRLSLGEKILIGADNNPDKKLATASFAAGNLPQAQLKFQNSLEANPNDPEALIYFNNALAAQAKARITIGVSVPIGGSLNVAKEILRGVAQAQQEINQQGGIPHNGKRALIQIQIANDDNDPETAQEIATHFVAQNEIIGVVGHNSSDSSIAAAPIYQKGNMVMISPTSVAGELSEAGSYIFRTTPSTKILAATLAKYTAEELNRQKIGVCLDSSSPASQSFRNEFSLALFELGGEMIDVSCDFADPQFAPEQIPSSAIANGAEALLLIPSVNQINQALDVARANHNRLVILGNHSMYTYETLKVGQSDIKGIVLPTAWHPDVTKNSAYNTNALRLWGMEGNWRTATAYDATRSLLAGLTTAQTRQELQATLVNPNFNIPGALGNINFKPSGDRQIEATIVKVQPGKISGTGYDFAPVNQNNNK